MNVRSPDIITSVGAPHSESGAPSKS